jgi:hypothetical protein
MNQLLYCWTCEAIPIGLTSGWVEGLPLQHSTKKIAASTQQSAGLEKTPIVLSSHLPVFDIGEIS